MTAPVASPTALELARACVITIYAGAMRHVRIVPPGTDPRHSVLWITVPAELVARHVEEAVATLAPFVDLGMARGRAEGSRPTLVIGRGLRVHGADDLEVFLETEPQRAVAPEVPYTVDDEDDQEID